MILLAVDAYSKLIEANVVHSSTTRVTIEQLRGLFATHGLAETLRIMALASVQFSSSLDRADRRGARLEASTVICFELGRLWAALHNSCGSRPVHSLMLSRYICRGLPRFLPPLTVPCSISLASMLRLVV